MAGPGDGARGPVDPLTITIPHRTLFPLFPSPHLPPLHPSSILSLFCLPLFLLTPDQVCANMGFSVSSTHTIFFIAAVFIAVAVVGVFHGAVNNFTGGVSDRGRTLTDELSTDIRIVTDPVLVPNNPVVLYSMNTGSKAIDPGEIVVLVNGRVHSDVTWQILGDDDGMWRTGQVIELTLVGLELPSGDHRIRVIAMHAAADNLSFNIGGGS